MPPSPCASSDIAPAARPRGLHLALDWQEATLRLSARSPGWLRNARLPVTVLPDGLVLDDWHGWRTALVAIESVEQGARLLLGHGPEAEVLAPAELRTELLRQAATVLALHSASRPAAH